MMDVHPLLSADLRANPAYELTCLDRLRAELEDRERERERLEALEREHDPAHESSRRIL